MTNRENRAERRRRLRDGGTRRARGKRGRRPPERGPLPVDSFVALESAGFLVPKRMVDKAKGFV